MITYHIEIMQTMLTSQQIAHFAQFDWIEFEQFITKEECKNVQLTLRECVATRLHTETNKLSRFTCEKLYLHGRDLWQSCPTIKRLICSKRFCSTIAELTHKHSMFLACDQWVPEDYLLDPLHLNDHLSFQNLLCGCILLLDEPSAGNVRFFRPERLPLSTGSQLIIAYGSLSTIYIHNPKDPLNASLKKYGYSFGDRLRSDTHTLCKG